MRRENVISVFGLVLMLLFAGAVSAAVNFTVNDDADVAYEDFDIISAGASQDGTTVVFWMEVRGSINLNPPDGYFYGYSVDVTTVTGHTISLSATAVNSSGATTVIVGMTVDGTDQTFLDPSTYSISGNRISFYVDSSIAGLSEGVDSVYFTTTRSSGVIAGTATDSVSYYASGDTSSTTSDTGDGTGGGMDWTPLPFLALGGIFCLLCYGLPFLISLLLAIWVYTDATRRGDDRAILWFVVVFFLSILGLIIYLVLRKEETPPPPPPPPQPPQPPQQ